MDRVLLGKNFNIDSTDNVGFWVSKPNINVTAIAGNSFFQGAIYGYNQQFEWTGASTDTHDFRDKNGDQSLRIRTTSNGTIQFTSNTNDPFFWRSLNASAFWHAPATGRDESFTGQDYPLLEIRLRRTPGPGGDGWRPGSSPTYFQYILEHAQDFTVLWSSSNSTFSWTDGGATYPWAGDRKMNIGAGIGAPTFSGWSDILTEQVDISPWATIEYDLENQIVTANCQGTIKKYQMGGAGHANWAADTKIDGLRFDFNAYGGGDAGTYGNKSDIPDLEVDYIRAKKRGIPMNFGDSANDSLQFDSGWNRTGLIHQTGVVQIGTEYAFANGTSKASGTSHDGSTSGRIEFPDLPYIPVVLFQRFDDTDATNKKSFPGGEKEFSFATCDLSQPTRTWNTTLGLWEETANSNFAAEFRTFAYVRASKDHFDLTCRNAIARDGYEWLFNYAPQEPYVELYKGGNYDPATEHQDSIVVKRGSKYRYENNTGDNIDGPATDLLGLNNPSTAGVAYADEPNVKNHSVTQYEKDVDGIVDNLAPGWEGQNWSLLKDAEDSSGASIVQGYSGRGALWHYGAFRGTDQGKCLPTFDWANKFGDWNIPQFNSFYKYVPSGSGGWLHGKGGEGTYKQFKDAIGESWTESNAKFLDDSMWLGWANNRNEMKGDIWHPQAPTKTFSERGGLLGFGGWTYDGTNSRGRAAGADQLDYDIYGGVSGQIYGTHSGLVGFRIGDDQRFGTNKGRAKTNYKADQRVLVRDVFEYIPDISSNLKPDDRWLQPPKPVVEGSGQGNIPWETGQIRQDDSSMLWRKKGPGAYSQYDLPNWELLRRGPMSRIQPYTAYATLPAWGAKDKTSGEGYTITRSYTYPGATYAYDISNFSGPAHYDVWNKNEEMNDYVERNVKTYKDSKSPGGVGAERENNDLPLSAAEQDLQKESKTMINHFRQSYEYNLPGKSPHRDGTLRPMGYGPYPLSLSTQADNSDDRLGISWYQDGDVWKDKVYVEQYPVSGTYVRPREGRSGWGTSKPWAMQRHGADQVIDSPKRVGQFYKIIGGISSNPADNEHTPPGIGQNTINLYPMSTAGDYELSGEGITGAYNIGQNNDKRAVCIIPTKSILSGETVMYSRHESVVARHGVTGMAAGGEQFIGQENPTISDSFGHPWYNFSLPTWYYLQGNIFPGMCKADNSLTYWGTEDLSEWGKDSDHRAHPTNGSFPLKEVARGMWDGTYMKTSARDDSGSIPVSGQGGQGGNYEDFSGYTKDIPEFQPVTGDGRFFGGVGGVNNRAPGFGDLLGPSLSPEPSIWDLKWSSIYHPFGMTPDPLTSDENSNTFYGSTTIQNQTSYIGGAPNKRMPLGNHEMASITSPGVYATYSGSKPHQTTPEEYDWCIGDPRINSNEWDRKLKRKDLTANTGKTAYHFQYTYDAEDEKIKPPKYKYWVLRIPVSISAYDGSGL